MKPEEALNLIRQMKSRFTGTGAEHDAVEQAIMTLGKLIAESQNTLIKEGDKENGKKTKG